MKCKIQENVKLRKYKNLSKFNKNLSKMNIVLIGIWPEHYRMCQVV